MSSSFRRSTMIESNQRPSESLASMRSPFLRSFRHRSFNASRGYSDRRDRFCVVEVEVRAREGVSARAPHRRASLALEKASQPPINVASWTCGSSSVQFSTSSKAASADFKTSPRWRRQNRVSDNPSSPTTSSRSAGLSQTRAPRSPRSTPAAAKSFALASATASARLTSTTPADSPGAPSSLTGLTSNRSRFTSTRGEKDDDSPSESPEPPPPRTVRGSAGPPPYQLSSSFQTFSLTKE
mmetsp:Transcript_36846/g.118160  ORF Transcript_36846/g.118160 Transcript_36846/m.118160 type:complete len:240 (+) Transcript_36846:1-720(+)